MNAQQATLLGLGCPDCGGGCSPAPTALSGLGVIDTPTDDWECFQWIDWHKQLVESYLNTPGVTKEKAHEYAKTIFLTWWDKINSFWGSLNWCGYKPEFFKYFKSVGITEHLSAGASVASPIISSVFDLSESAGGIITKTGEAGENTAGAAGNTAKVLKVLIPLAITAGVVGLGYYGYKHYIKGNEKIKVKHPLKGIPTKTKKVIHI